MVCHPGWKREPALGDSGGNFRVRQGGAEEHRGWTAGRHDRWRHEGQRPFCTTVRVPLAWGCISSESHLPTTLLDVRARRPTQVIVDCYWRSSKNTSTAQLYNISADIGEWNDLSAEEPALLKKVLARLEYWEGQSVDPYTPEPGCGEGKPQGKNPAHWDSWC